MPFPATAFAIGTVALLLAMLTKQRWWWRIIHFFFVPLAWWFTSWGIDPVWYLFAAFMTLTVYRGAITGRVPLFLSNRKTVNALSILIEERQGTRFLDLGAGIGSVVRPLARRFRSAHFSGIENAPATWLLGYVMTRGLKNCAWRWGNLRNAHLGEYDIVYAFLSPAAMPELWKKACREMRSGTVFVSNSFPAPGTEATEIIEVDDARNTVLYCYRI